MFLKQAQDIAVEICYKLQPFCSRIKIAGSIRRKREVVGDIEIVCCPYKIQVGQSSLFGAAVEVAVPAAFSELVLSLGKVEKGHPNGRMMCIMLPQKIKLDLFMPQPDDFFRIYAIRTGSSTYSSVVIAHAWSRLGWCGTDHGLRRIEDCEAKGENKWKLVNKDGQRPPVWQSEEEFFQWLGLNYLQPQFR